MQKNSYLIILDSLNRKELRLFRGYFDLFYGGQKKLKPVFEYYTSFYKKRKQPPPVAEAYPDIYKKVPESPKNLADLRNRISDLHIIVKEFLIQQKLKEKKFERDFLWLEVLEDKNLAHQKKLHLESLFRDFARANAPTIWQDFHQLQLHHHTFFKNKFENLPQEAKMVEQALLSLEEFYRNMKFKLAAELTNLESVIGLEYQQLDMQELTIGVTDNFSPYSTLAQFYSLVYSFKIQQNDPTFEQLKSFLFQNDNRLPFEDRLIAVIYLINFIAAQIKNGGTAFIQRGFEVYKYGLDEQILTYQNTINQTNFENIVSIACRIQDYQWAKEFAQAHQNYLTENIRKDTFTLSMATIYFSQGKFQMVIDTLDKTNLSNIFQELRAKALVLRSYFELGNDEEVAEGCTAFLRFLRRPNNKLGEGNRTATKNFCILLKKLLDVNLDKKEMSKMIQEKKPLFFKEWLLSKC
jgi:hypothetical protein